MEFYPALKLIHVLFASLLFGTGLGTAFYMWRAHRDGGVQTIAAVARNVVLADWLFTTPAIIVQPVTGFLLINVLGYPLSQTWIVLTGILYLLAGACWLPVVWLQIQMRNLARKALAENTELPAAYHRYFSIWFALGWPAFISVLVIFYLMIYKPVF